MNIKEAEKRTGVTKQNIRFYEKKGLLSPQRNQENSYREYSEEDVETLMRIKMFRKLDISLENIQRILTGEDQNAIIQQHLELLLEKQESLDAAIAMCRFLLREQAVPADTRAMLDKMEQIEQKGGRFMSIINDYKKIAAAENKRVFTFRPDIIIQTPEEFSEALFQYGRENDLNLVITKEGMYPKFEIDGLEYEAYRHFGRFGAVVTCEVTDASRLKEEYADVGGRRGRILRMIHMCVACCTVPVIICLFLILTGRDISAAIFVGIIEIPLVWWYYRNFLKD